MSFPVIKLYDNMQFDMKAEMELWSSYSEHAEKHVSHKGWANSNNAEISTSRFTNHTKQTCANYAPSPLI